MNNQNQKQNCKAARQSPSAARHEPPHYARQVLRPFLHPISLPHTRSFCKKQRSDDRRRSRFFAGKRHYLYPLWFIYRILLPLPRLRVRTGRVHPGRLPPRHLLCPGNPHPARRLRALQDPIRAAGGGCTGSVGGRADGSPAWRRTPGGTTVSFSFLGE